MPPTTSCNLMSTTLSGYDNHLNCPCACYVIWATMDLAHTPAIPSMPMTFAMHFIHTMECHYINYMHLNILWNFQHRAGPKLLLFSWKRDVEHFQHIFVIGIEFLIVIHFMGEKQSSGNEWKSRFSTSHWTRVQQGNEWSIWIWKLSAIFVAW